MTITPEKKEPGRVESAPLASPASEPSAPRGLFASYKEDQGRHVRMAAFWSVVFFLGFGCRFLHDLLIQWSSLREPVGGMRLPVVRVNLSPAFIVSALIFGVGLVVIHRWQQRPRVAELLIETETELRKVSWPKAQEVWNASVVVILSVVVIGALLALADVLLYRLLVQTLITGAD
jgi:preprotein translocase SecE subunit